MILIFSVSWMDSSMFCAALPGESNKLFISLTIVNEDAPKYLSNAVSPWMPRTYSKTAGKDLVEKEVLLENINIWHDLNET